MRNSFIISIVMISVFCGCNKNKYQSTPSLKYRSVNTTQLHNFDVIQFKLSFTDKEGDLTDTMTIIEAGKHKCALSNLRPLKYKLPTFPTTKNISGDILVTLDHNRDIPPKCGLNDTVVFKFVLKDKAQHVSDTATSETIIIYQN